MGPGDHHCSPGQARIACERTRDRHDRIIVQEKLDGSCTAIANVDGQILALTRAGYPAWSSPYRQHHLFALWVQTEEARFRALLAPGERAVGEWLLQAHGTRYDLPHEPWVVFDLMQDTTRAPFDIVTARVQPYGFTQPRVLQDGPPLSIAGVQSFLETSGHGACDPVEGAVWRVERQGVVDFLVKWVRPDKRDGCYLPGQGLTEHEIWNHWPGDRIGKWQRPARAGA